MSEINGQESSMDQPGQQNTLKLETHQGPRTRWGLITFGAIVLMSSLLIIAIYSNAVPWEVWRVVFNISAESWIFIIISGIGAVAILGGVIALIRSAQRQKGEEDNDTAMMSYPV